MQRLDLQVLQGNGVGPNLLGLLNVPGIQTYARGAETNFDAIFRAMALVQVTGRASTTGILMHPTNWTTIRLATANGLYIFGPPTDAGVARLWGVPVSVTDIIPAGTALVGDFAAHSSSSPGKASRCWRGSCRMILFAGRARESDDARGPGDLSSDRICHHHEFELGGGRCLNIPRVIS